MDADEEEHVEADAGFHRLVGVTPALSMGIGPGSQLLFSVEMGFFAAG